MYRLGKYFEKLDRQMGYKLKWEYYDVAARSFAKIYLNNPKAKVFERVRNGRMELNGKKTNRESR